MRVLINVPPLKYSGGVSGHYLGLKDHWKIKVKYNVIYKRRDNRFGRFIAPFNIAKFLINIFLFNPHLILLNVSLKKGIYSLLFYHKLAKVFNKKVSVFIHGWDNNYESQLNNNKLRCILNSSESIIVLSKEFKTKLSNHKIVAPIYLTTTKVSDELVKSFKISDRDGQVKKFLFVSRIEKEKGIYETLACFQLLQEKFHDLSMTFVGDGSELLNLENYINSNHIKNVRITGKLTGTNLIKEYSSADFFFLLTTWGEGLPAALIEALAFGLPVATRPVGGIKDFFIDKKMGILSDSLEPCFFSTEISNLMLNQKQIKEISGFNYQFAQEHFLASSVAIQMEEIFNNSVKVMNIKS
jgi:glycosyltransferase involved in cell wall biosynthesis